MSITVPLPGGPSLCGGEAPGVADFVERDTAEVVDLDDAVT
ncbi:MAG: hypothetical protein ACRDRV_01575 [Pseudonocardiaceae bacterium]